MGLIISLFKPECGMDFYSMSKENATSCGKISGGLIAFIILLLGLFISVIIHYQSKKIEQEKPEGERTNRPIINFFITLAIVIFICLFFWGLTYLYYTSSQTKYHTQFENLKARGISESDALNFVSRSSDASKLAESVRPSSGGTGVSALTGFLGGILGSSLSKK